MLPKSRHFDEVRPAIEEFRLGLGAAAGLRVLDVGCGRENWLIDTSDCRTTGLDPSVSQLEANPHLDERIVGSIETFELEDWNERFDIVVASYVLEHLRDPIAALNKLSGWLKPEGRLLLAIPNTRSVKGYVTQFTPLFVHRWFYKLSLGEGAPPEDGGPFPTYMRRAIRLDELERFFAEKGMQIGLLVTFESFQNVYLRRFVPDALLDAVNARLLGPLRQELSPRATDILLSISKKHA